MDKLIGISIGATIGVGFWTLAVYLISHYILPFGFDAPPLGGKQCFVVGTIVWLLLLAMGLVKKE